MNSLMACLMVLGLTCTGNAQHKGVLSADFDKLASLVAGSTPAKVQGKVERRFLKIVFLLKFESFGCLDCLNEFVDMCDTLQKLKAAGDRFESLLIFQQGKRDPVRQKSEMATWLKSLGIKTKFLIRDDVFESVDYLGSSFVIFDEENKPIFYDEFPLHADKQEQICGILHDSRR